MTYLIAAILIYALFEIGVDAARGANKEASDERNWHKAVDIVISRHTPDGATFNEDMYDEFVDAHLSEILEVDDALCASTY